MTDTAAVEQGKNVISRSLRADAGSRGVAYRLLAFILVFSSIAALLSTLVQLYADYRRDLDAIDVRIHEIEKSYLGGIAGSLWNVDSEQLRVLMDGLMRLPDIRGLEVRETAASVARPLVVTIGNLKEGSAVKRDLPIVYDDRGSLRNIGVLTIHVGLDEVYRRLLDKAMVILVTQGVKTFLVSMFILYVVYRLVTRHLIYLADYLRAMDLRKPMAALSLKRTKPSRPDELDQVVDTINSMSDNLRQAYEELRQVNAELQADIVARIKAEQEVIHLNSVLEQRVRHRTAELEAANAELAAFSYSVSHDLRAPLRRIEGFARILCDEYGDGMDDRGIHCLDRIRAGTADLGEMIESFLKLSRLTRGTLAIERVPLTVIVEEVVAGLRERDPDRVVEVEIQPDMTVEGDRRLLKVLMQNLVENAWKYSRTRTPAVIRAGIEIKDGRRCVFVADNGVGFDMAYKDRMFKPFSRLHPVEQFEGSGIGLTTVQRIVGRHGGSIWAEAEVDKGAAFYFTLWEGNEEDAPTEDSAG